jgi:hypothetical protein
LRTIYEGQSHLTEVVALLTELGFYLEDITEALRTWPDGRLWQVDTWWQRAD